MAFSISSRSITGCPLYISTMTGSAPTWHITLQLAVYVYAGTITSSPGPIPRNLSVISIDAVAELRHAVFSVPIYSDISLSNFFVFGPVVIHPDFKVSTTESISACEISGGENGIFIFSPLLVICDRIRITYLFYLMLDIITVSLCDRYQFIELF